MASFISLPREARGDGFDRFVDLCLLLRRQRTGETILSAGGRWDRLQQTFAKSTPEQAYAIDLAESQVPFARWFAGWLAELREGRTRDVQLVLNEGPARSGVTFGSLACVVAALIDVPRLGDSSTVAALVSESREARAELERLLLELLPASWRWRDGTDGYCLVNGALLRNLTVHQRDCLRRGRLDLLLCNQATHMTARTMVDGLLATGERGGLTILTARPPMYDRGHWMSKLRASLVSGRIDGGKCFTFGSEERLDSGTRTRIDKLLATIDPEAE